jgi:CRISPR-associated protein Csd1
MIFQALYQLAQEEELPLDFEPRPVAWLVRVSDNGDLLGIRGTHHVLPARGKGKAKEVPKRFWIPRQPTGKSGTKAPASFLVDNAKYVFGLPTKGKSFPKKEGTEKSGWFRKLVANCANETKDEGALAVLRFLEKIEEGQIVVNLPNECHSNDLFAFEFAPDSGRLVHERVKVHEYWIRCRESSKRERSAELRCLVSGTLIGEPGLFPLIEKIPGANPSRIGLVSFNSNAFESYGWKSNANAPISHDAAEYCATALNRLLDEGYLNPHQPGQTLPQRSLRVSSDTAVCYWSPEKTGGEFCTAFGGLLEAKPEVVNGLYQSIWYGKVPEIDDPSTFYALTLSGTQGRAIVRDWFESTVANVASNLATTPSVPISLLLKSLAPQGDSEKIPPPLIGQLVEAALHGTTYPFSILQRAVERARAEIGRATDEGVEGYRAKERSDARAAIIKALLNRRRRFFPQTALYKEVQPDMDPNNLSEGYTLGRLMAILERIQQEAIDNVNATVVDRYFSGASASPKTVFVRLLRNARHHVTKAKDNETKAGFIFRLDKLIDELANHFDPKNNGFPAFLDLEQQGLFVLGYHQMRKWLWMSRAERAEWEENHLEAPKEYLWSREK